MHIFILYTHGEYLSDQLNWALSNLGWHQRSLIYYLSAGMCVRVVRSSCLTPVSSNSSTGGLHRNCWSLHRSKSTSSRLALMSIPAVCLKVQVNFNAVSSGDLSWRQCFCSNSLVTWAALNLQAIVLMSMGREISGLFSWVQAKGE